MPYKFRDDLSIADVAFDVEEPSLELLFKSAAKAVENTMIKNIKDIESKVERKIELYADNEEKLLHDFLDELVYYKDADMLIFNSFKIEISGSKLTAIVKGEKIDAKKHQMLVDVKSVTWHRFSLKKSGKKWKATVILDV